MTNAQRDQNHTPTMLGVSSVDGVTPIPIEVNPITGAIKAEIIGTYGIPEAPIDGKTYGRKDTTWNQVATGTGTATNTNTGDQTIANSSDATSHTVTLSASGGSVKLVEGSNITLTTTGTAGDGIVTISSTASGSGDVVGPATNTADYIPQWNGANSKTLKNGLALDTDLTSTSANDDSVPSAKATKTYADTKKPYHGIVARPVGTGNPLPTTITTTTFTLGATSHNISYYYQGTLVNVTANKTTTLSGAAGLYWVYFDAATGNITNSTTFPGIDFTSNVIICSVNWNGSNLGLINDERHGYGRCTSWHSWAHKTVGARYASGITMTNNGGTGAAATFATTAGEIWDEDIQFTVDASSAFPSANAGRLFYQTGASTYAFVSATATTPGYLGANNRPNYVNTTGYALTQMTSANNRFINVFIYATTDLHTPIYFFTETVTSAIAGTNGYTTIALARAVPFPNLSAFGLSPEMKPIYRTIWRADGVLQAIDTAQDDYRTVSSLPMSAGTNSTTASAVSYNPTGTLTGTTVQTAIDELEANKVPNSRTLTINGTTLDLSADRSWTIAGGGMWTAVAGSPTRASNTTFTVTGDYTSLFAKGMILKWTESSTVRYGMVSIPSTYSNPNTTITIIGSTMASIDASSLKYCLIGAETFIANFAIAGSIGATGTDVANAYYAKEPMVVLGADLQVGTAGTTNSTTIDINKGGTTMFTTKPTLATTVASSPTPFTADTATTLALADKVTIDIDAVQTTAAVDLYVQLYLLPTRYANL